MRPVPFLVNIVCIDIERLFFIPGEYCLFLNIVTLILTVNCNKVCNFSDVTLYKFVWLLYFYMRTVQKICET